MANPIDMYGPYYGGYLHQKDANQDRTMQGNQQGMQALGILSTMARQVEQNKLLMDMFNEGMGGNVASQALRQGAAQGDIGPTNTNAERMGLLSQQQNAQSGVPGSRFTPRQWESMAYMNPPAAKALLEARSAFLPKFTTDNGAIMGGPPGQPPAFQGFAPQARISNEGQAAILRPDASGNLTMSAPTGAVDLYGQYKRAAEEAKGANPLGVRSQDLSEAEARDKGITVPLRPNLPRPGSRERPGGLGATPIQGPPAIPDTQLQMTEPDVARAERTALDLFNSGVRNFRVDAGAPGTSSAPQGLAISPAQQRKLEEDRPKATYAYETNTANLDRLASMAIEIANDKVGLAGISGIPGMVFNIPGGAAANAEAKLDTLKNQVFINTIQAMRDASPTGGALGSISEKEGVRMESALVPLRKAQSAAQLKTELLNVAKIAHESKARLRQAYDMVYPNARNQILPPEGTSAQGGVAAQPQGQVIDFRSLK